MNAFHETGSYHSPIHLSLHLPEPTKLFFLCIFLPNDTMNSPRQRQSFGAALHL